MVSVALRTSSVTGGIFPPLTKTLATSERRRMRSEMMSVTACVSASCEPGGSSTASVEREVSGGGRKPVGSCFAPHTRRARRILMPRCRRREKARTGASVRASLERVQSTAGPIPTRFPPLEVHASMCSLLSEAYPYLCGAALFVSYPFFQDRSAISHPPPSRSVCPRYRPLCPLLRLELFCCTMVPWLNKKEMLKAPHSILPEHLVRRSQSTMQVQPRHVGTHGTPTGRGGRWSAIRSSLQTVPESGEIAPALKLDRRAHGYSARRQSG